MTTIWKYPFAIADVVTLDMPANAIILRVECQAGIPCIWAWVEPADPPTPRRFRVVGTGLPVPHGASEHVATFQQGPFVWHLFDC